MRKFQYSKKRTPYSFSHPSNMRSNSVVVNKSKSRDKSRPLLLFQKSRLIPNMWTFRDYFHLHLRPFHEPRPQWLHPCIMLRPLQKCHEINESSKALSSHAHALLMTPYDVSATEPTTSQSTQSERACVRGLPRNRQPAGACSCCHFMAISSVACWQDFGLIPLTNHQPTRRTSSTKYYTLVKK